MYTLIFHLTILIWIQPFKNRVESSVLKRIQCLLNYHSFRELCNRTFRHQDGRRIIGGKAAKIRNYPFFVLVVPFLSETDIHHRSLCGGSHIATQWILTAAHCVYGNLTIAYGFVYKVKVLWDVETWYQAREKIASEENTYDHMTAKNFFIPLKFRTTLKRAHDIALIKLPHRSARRNFIKLVKRVRPFNYYEAGKAITVLGFGLHHKIQLSDYQRRPSPKLKRLTTYIWDHNRCTIISSSDEIICFGRDQRKRIASGDSGGPAFAYRPSDNEKLLVGVLNGGLLNIGLYNQMGVSEGPSYAIKVINHLAWIKSIIPNI